MGTLNLPSYEPQQIPSDESQRRLDVSGQVALGRSRSNLLSSAMEGVGLLGKVFKTIRQQKQTSEFNAAQLRYKQDMTAKLRELETNPLKSAGEVPSDDYGTETSLDLPNHKALVEYRKAIVEQINGGMKYDKAREAFNLWADNAFVSEQDAILEWDINKTREVLLDNGQETFSQAIELGDPSLAKDVADSLYDAGTIDQKQHDDYLDEGFLKIAGRNALNYARSLGFENGERYLANRENLKWQTHKGEERTLNLQQQESLIRAFQEEKRIAEAEETKAVLGRLSLMNTDYVAREMTLTEREILSNEFLRGKGNRPDVAQFVEKWVDAVRRRTITLAKGGDPTRSDPASLEEAYRILGEGFLSDEEKLRRIQLVKGLSATDYTTKFKDLNLALYRDGTVQQMLRDIDSYYKPRLAKVNEKTRPQEWTELNDEWNRSKDDLIRSLETLPPNASVEQKREAVRQVKDRIVEKYVFHAFTKADLGFGDRGSINKFEQDLIDAVDGKFKNVQFKYSEDLVKLGEGIKVQLSNAMGKDPDNVWDGEIQAGAVILDDGRTAWMFDGLLYTLRVDSETKDETLQRYNAKTRRFEDVPWTPEQWARIKPYERPEAGPTATPPIPAGPSEAVGAGRGIGTDLRTIIPAAGRNIENPAAMATEQLEAEIEKETSKGRGADAGRLTRLRQELASRRGR